MLLLFAEARLRCKQPAVGAGVSQNAECDADTIQQQTVLLIDNTDHQDGEFAQLCEAYQWKYTKIHYLLSD